MKMSVACGTENHDHCDGTSFNIPADDPTAKNLPQTQGECACICHKLEEKWKNSAQP